MWLIQAKYQYWYDNTIFTAVTCNCFIVNDKSLSCPISAGSIKLFYKAVTVLKDIKKIILGLIPLI